MIDKDFLQSVAIHYLVGRYVQEQLAVFQHDSAEHLTPERVSDMLGRLRNSNYALGRWLRKAMTDDKLGEVRAQLGLIGLTDI